MEGPKWQTEFTTVRDRNRYALDNSLFCDIEFSVLDLNEKKATLKAHKYVLAITSPVFDAMFYGKIAETGPTIHLPDCTKEGLREMLRYVYSDEVNLTGRNVLDVLYLAQKYMMPFLENRCNEYLQTELRPEDVFIVLLQAQQMKNEKAEMCCWNVIDFETERVVTSEQFLDISRELLCQVLARETLHVEEIELFKAVDKWASHHIIEEDELKNDGPTKRQVLGEEAIRLVRFPAISPHEFAQNVIDKNILSTSEIVKVLSSVSTSEVIIFNPKKRAGQWNEMWSPNRFKKLSGDIRMWDPQHCIQFQTNKPVFLTGVRLFADKRERQVVIKLKVSKIIVPDLGLCSWPKRQKVDSKSSNSSATSNRTCVELERRFKVESVDGLYFGLTVLLDDPVPLEPNEWYLIEANLNAYSHFAGSEGQGTVQCDDVTITFKNVTNDDNSTTVEVGQFPSFLLKRKIELRAK